MFWISVITWHKEEVHLPPEGASKFYICEQNESEQKQFPIFQATGVKQNLKVKTETSIYRYDIKWIQLYIDKEMWIRT